MTDLSPWNRNSFVSGSPAPPSSPTYTKPTGLVSVAPPGPAMPVTLKPTDVPARSRIPVAMARALHEAIAGATLEVIAGARHLTPLEVPDRVARALVELLDRRAKEVSP